MLRDDNDRYGVAQSIQGRLHFKREDKKEKAMSETIPVTAVHGIPTFPGHSLGG